MPWSCESAVAMVTVCQKCGVTGYPELLIYCSQCQLSAEHRYCLDRLPEHGVLEVTWSCEECIPRVSTQSSFNELSLCPSRKKERLKKGEKDKINFAVETDVQDGNSEGYQSSGRRRRKLILEDGSSSDEEAELAKARTSQIDLGISSAPAGISIHLPSTEYHDYVHAIPIIDPIWRGSFNICNEKYGLVAGLVAHLSNKACLKVFEGASALPLLLSVELLPRHDAWPKTFCRSPPTDDNIALYFFPGRECDKTIFDGLLHDIIDWDLAMKAVIDDAELLIFPSLQLPQPYWRFLGKCYLWGVFRGKQVSLPHKPADHLHIRKSSTECEIPSIPTDDPGSREGRGPSTTQSRQSPLSPLSRSSSYGSDSLHSPLHQKAISSRFSEVPCPCNTEKSGDYERDAEEQRIEACDVMLPSHRASWPASFDASKEKNDIMFRPCLKLSPVEVEDIAIVTKVGRSSGLELELGLG